MKNISIILTFALFVFINKTSYTQNEFFYQNYENSKIANYTNQNILTNNALNIVNQSAFNLSETNIDLFENSSYFLAYQAQEKVSGKSIAEIIYKDIDLSKANSLLLSFRYYKEDINGLGNNLEFELINGNKSIIISSELSEEGCWTGFETKINDDFHGKNVKIIIRMVGNNLIAIDDITIKNKSHNAISENNFNDIFRFYPNPAKDKLYISSTENGKLKIMNSLGKKIDEIPIYPGNKIIDLTRYHSGVYYLIFDYINNTETKKLFIK